MKLIEITKPNWIPVSQMEDGQIAIIRKWSINVYVGRIIQRHNNQLITLGLPSGNSFSNIPLHDDCQVEILPPGSKLEI